VKTDLAPEFFMAHSKKGMKILLYERHPLQPLFHRCAIIHIHRRRLIDNKFDALNPTWSQGWGLFMTASLLETLIKGKIHGSLSHLKYNTKRK
jgi:hypothetical protein